MKFLIISALIAAVSVNAQISALPACGLTCGAQVASATPCANPLDFNCTCQASNQAIIEPLLIACLQKTCTSAADINATIAAGEAICAPVVQLVSSSSAAPSTATSSASSSVAPVSTTTEAASTTVVAVTPSVVASTTSTPSSSSISTTVLVSQISDGQPQATSAAPATTSVAPYTGGAMGMRAFVTGGQVLLAAAGAAAFAL